MSVGLLVCLFLFIITILVRLRFYIKTHYLLDYISIITHYLIEIFYYPHLNILHYNQALYIKYHYLKIVSMYNLRAIPFREIQSNQQVYSLFLRIHLFERPSRLYALLLFRFQDLRNNTIFILNL